MSWYKMQCCLSDFQKSITQINMTLQTFFTFLLNLYIEVPSIKFFKPKMLIKIIIASVFYTKISLPAY